MDLKFRIPIIIYFLIFLLGTSCISKKEKSTVFEFSNDLDRIWIGPDFWANRIQDWQINDGKLICTTSANNRNLQLITYHLDSTSNYFKIRSSLGFTDATREKSGWIGIRFAGKGEFKDYRDDAIYGKGIDVGITTDNTFFIGDLNVPFQYKSNEEGYILELEGKENEDKFIVTGSLLNGNSQDKLASFTFDSLQAENIFGNIGFISSFVEEISFNNDASAWFSDISLIGDKIVHQPDHAYGPILFTQYTLSKETLKLSAQFPPVSTSDNEFATLEIYDSTRQEWINPIESALDPDSRNATFKVESWQFEDQVPYRVAYTYSDYNGDLIDSFFEGVIQPDPINKNEIKVAAFTGNNDLGFPDNDLIENVKKHDPDLLFFSGDQIYEGVGGFGVQRTPVDMAILDYLRKWYQFGWIYRDLIKSRPSVAITDDHDVFHGNIWGANGKAVPAGLTGTEAQDQGGYKMPTRFVNMVQKTQTSHLPDPYDPRPVEQGINVYYTDLTYGGISFAILEDRKFKSGPTPLLPEGKIWNGWFQNPDFDPKTQSDHPDAKLLGDRQLEFLHNWSADWSGGVWMKALLSQTIFANVATLPEEEVHDQNVPKLRILAKDEYAPNDKLVADMDSNGWPKSGRDEALRIIRKGFAVHIAGDQHLGSTIQYGIDEYGDAGYAICVPSVSNVWPRRWYPPIDEKDNVSNGPTYTGDFEDGFGNKMTVLAVSNPEFTGRQPSRLYDRATGYGIITFQKDTRTISMANWPRDADPTDLETGPYEGWPVEINQLDNYLPSKHLLLATIKTTGIENPVVRVMDEETKEIIYTIRTLGNTFDAPINRKGIFTVLVGDPDSEMKEVKGLVPGENLSVEIEFE